MPTSNRHLTRRTALKLAASASALPMIKSAAGIAENEEFQSFVPQDKQLDPNFVQRLYEVGEPSKWTGDQLKFIGMPIGGLCCGQVYLGGDGRLWNWDICTTPTGWDMSGLSSGKHYANPMVPYSPLQYQVELEIGGKVWKLDSQGFSDITFTNEYPRGNVRYENPDCPVSVVLQAWSPFIPLETEDSSLPLILLDYHVIEKTASVVEGKIRISLENPIGKFTNRKREIAISSNRRTVSGMTLASFHSTAIPRQMALGKPDFVIADFEWEDYRNWKVEGTAFGDRPMRVAELPERYRSANPVGKSFINTHQSRAGEESVQADQHLGKLTSPEFVIRHNFINFWIGGGNHPGKTCLNLIVNGKVVRTATGHNSLRLRKESFDVKEFINQMATIEIVDQEAGGWGHITVDQIMMSDNRDVDEIPVSQAADFGSFTVAALGSETSADPSGMLETGIVEYSFTATSGKPGRAQFGIAWYFPNYGSPRDSFAEITDISKLKKHYAKRFKSAEEVVLYFQRNQKRLASDSQKWCETWRDSTLPNYFLERAIIPIDCLQTATSHRFDSGRFYGWEGVYCCPGTCQHVWNYAQAAARLFPELERSARQHADYGISWQPDGTIWYRGESGRHMAHDGQAGTILRTYREHSTSKDSKFLSANWAKIKKSIERLVADDPNKDGLWEGEQYNTLDSSWYGKVSWISSLYIAALRAGVEMANEMGDADFAKELTRITESGAKLIVKETYNGEYFAMVRDPGHPRAAGHGPGCHIDQVFGDSFLHMVGLPPNLPRNEVKSGLKSIWKYNYTPDAGGYMKAMQSVIKGGRWYAMPGEPGLLMTTFPTGGAKESKGEGNPDWMVGYFNECMNGFEYQAAAHMIAEGMVTEGLAIVYALHSRYTNGTRNPYNEVECSDHYSRSMASYGAFLTACGFAYHGPKGYLRFAPKLPGNHFKAAFTSAEGWGSYEHNLDSDGWKAELALAYGSLRINQLELSIASACVLSSCKMGSTKVDAKLVGNVIHFTKPLQIRTGQKLALEFRLVV
jgi:uncharacterized protein (DUF608 family)